MFGDSLFDNVQIFPLDTFAGPLGDAFFMPATPHSAGIDLYATKDLTLLPGERALMPLGFKMAMPTHLEAQIRPKSGRALKEGLTVLNTPGTIDPDYRDEVGVILYNSNPVLPAALITRLMDRSPQVHEVEDAEFLTTIREHTIEIKQGQKVAQLVFTVFERPEIETVDVLDATERAGGFGSTGLEG